MLDNVSSIFEDRNLFLKKMRRPTYEKNMEIFEQNHGHFFEEIISAVNAADDKQAVAEEYGECLARQVKEAFAKKKRPSPQLSMDLNLMMIYYFFPGILRTGNGDAKLIADAFKNKWNEVFATSIDYANYETIREGFSNKLFGLF